MYIISLVPSANVNVISETLKVLIASKLLGSLIDESNPKLLG
jgi:hypothetical protein